MRKCSCREAKATGPRPRSWEWWFQRPCLKHLVTLPPMTISLVHPALTEYQALDYIR